MIRTHKGVRPLAELVTGLIAPACRKRGVANATLIMAGADLFGERLAGSCEVERIVWPRGSRIDTGLSTGATLVVRAKGASALMLQHIAPQVVERANLLIGWPAIAKVRVTQVFQTPRAVASRGPLRRPPLQEAAIAAHADRLGDVTHQNLKLALARLAAGIDQRSSPNGEKDP